jgi:hypothetical protein
VKLGAENRKETIAAVVLGAIALFTMTRMFWSSGSSAAPVVSQVQAPAGLPDRPAARRTSGGKAVKVVEPRLDPTLDLDLLQTSEQIKYAGNGRNIFMPGSEPVIPKPIKQGNTDAGGIKPAPPNPPLPPINLKFFGFASKPGEPKRIFLSQNEDVFIAAEGDIVNRRYRVLHIAPNSVEIEDVISSNRQSIPLTQG